MTIKINRRSAMPKPAKVAAPKRAKPKAKWDDAAKQRIISHFKRELSQSHGVKR